ncbi:MAG: DsbA family protein [Nitrospiraceae bacterium]|nr:MAG: DsbA family protein [Nitrospiraceae bacterium]
MTGRIEQLKKEYEIDVCWRAFPLHPETPEEGTLLEDLFSGFSSQDLKTMKDRLKKAADEAGLPLGDRMKTFNSSLAQELGKWAETKDKGDPFHFAVFRAFFADGINIAKISALMDITASVGLSRDEAEEVISYRTFKADVDKDWSLASEKGITAVPTFVMNNARLVGTQPYEMLERLMEEKGVKKRSYEL